jgi:hypothetical protein
MITSETDFDDHRSLTFAVQAQRFLIIPAKPEFDDHQSFTARH